MTPSAAVVFCIVLVLSLPLPLRAQVAIPPAGIINTIAGNGTGGYSGDGGAATSAELYGNFGVAVDGAGNIYIADAYNQRIRKVTASTGVISTVAGSGGEGYSGDGGPATSAQLYEPCGVAVDRAGNIYIADSWNGRIRVVNTGTQAITIANIVIQPGYIETVAENLYEPLGVAVDSSGNIYIADTFNYRIRKVTAATGAISTVAGNGTQGYSGDGGAATSAELNRPEGVAVDSSGNIYIADLYNNRIRKVTAATGVISTMAGNGTQGYSGDGGAATSAELDQPEGVAVDSSGNIYIADSARIREVAAATGVISTVAGNGALGYSGDGGTATSAEIYDIGVAVDSSGNIYIADPDYSRIRIVGGAGVLPIPPGNATVLSNLQLSNSPSGTSWGICTGTNCAGGSNTGSGTDAFGISSPSLSGASMSQTSNGNGFNTLLYKHLHCSLLPSGCTGLSNMLTDFWYYIPSTTTAVQALEFDPDATIQPYTIKASVQCLSPNAGGYWRYWDSSVQNWIKPPQTYPCSVVTATGTWHHQQMWVTYNWSASPPTYTYQALVLDGVTVFSGGPIAGVHAQNTGTSSNWPTQFWVEQQIDNNSTATSNTVYYDEYKLTVW